MKGEIILKKHLEDCKEIGKEGVKTSSGGAWS